MADSRQQTVDTRQLFIGDVVLICTLQVLVCAIYMYIYVYGTFILCVNDCVVRTQVIVHVPTRVRTSTDYREYVDD